MRHLKARAALEGRSLRDLVLELVERGLKACAPPLARWINDGAPPLPAHLWADAWLAASAKAAGLRLVTFDADFDRFPFSRRLRLGSADT